MSALPSRPPRGRGALTHVQELQCGRHFQRRIAVEELDRLHASHVNGWSPLDPRLPWGGWKFSGHGRELAPEEAIASNADRVRHRKETEAIPVVTLDDLEWADGYAFGTPTRCGAPAGQLKQFIETANRGRPPGSTFDGRIESNAPRTAERPA